jgi:hypothetical protein
MLATEIAVIVLGYLLGSIPFAYILGRIAKGIDIRQSGNVGTLSVMRDVGTFAGLANLVLDMGKGSLAVGAAQWLGAPSNHLRRGFCRSNGTLLARLRSLQGRGGVGHEPREKEPHHRQRLHAMADEEEAGLICHHCVLRTRRLCSGLVGDGYLTSNRVSKVLF